MSRSEKGSRARGLPARIRLQEQQEKTGSFPTIWRTASDNRTGKYRTFFDDTKGINFVQYDRHTYPSLQFADSIKLWWRFEEEVDAGATNWATIPPSNGDLTGSPIAVFSGTLLKTSDVPSVNYPPLENYTNMQAWTVQSGDPYVRQAVGGNSLTDPTGTDFTACGWFNVSVIPNPTPTGLMSSDNFGYTSTNWYILIDPVSNQLFFGAFDGTTSNYNVYRTTNTVPFNVGQWHHYAIAWDKTLLTPNLYIDSVLYDNSIVATAGTFTGFNAQSGGGLNLGFVWDMLNSAAYIFSGSYDDFMYFNKKLTQPEIQYIYNGANSGGGIDIPTSLPSGSQYLTSEIQTNFGEPISGRAIKGIADNWVSFTPGQDLQPFRDNDNPAVDAMRNDSTTNNSNPFYATGSLISSTGQGFQQPLWSKTKIEIDLTPAIESSFGIVDGSDTSYAMAFLDKKRGYVGVGSGKELSKYSGTSLAQALCFFNEKAVGFGSSEYGGAITNSEVLSLNPITNFGFPDHAKYNGSVDMLFDMSNYINEPFLLEKMVLYVSATFRTNGQVLLPTAIANTFFVLNQRNAAQFLPIDNTIFFHSGNSVLRTVTHTLVSSSCTGSIRDLVTWAQIAHTNVTPDFDNIFLKSKEFNVPGFEWNQQFIVSGNIKSPIEYARGLTGIVSYNADSTISTTEYYDTWKKSGRNVREENARSWINVVQNPEFSSSVSIGTYWAGNQNVSTNKSYSKVAPYLLLPTDKLIFGWQVSTPQLAWYSNGSPLISGTTNGTRLYFGTSGIHKIVFYGSLLRVDEKGELTEHHDTLNQLLSSEMIHETIGR